MKRTIDGDEMSVLFGHAIGFTIHQYSGTSLWVSHTLATATRFKTCVTKDEALNVALVETERRLVRALEDLREVRAAIERGEDPFSDEVKT